MSVTPGYRAYLFELFAKLGAVDVRRVFGFDGLFLGETMFGLVADERVYLKTDEESRAIFRQEGAQPLTYRARDGQSVVTSYFEMPEHLYDEAAEAAEWAQRAYEVALKSPTAARRQRRSRGMGAPQPARRRRSR